MPTTCTDACRPYNGPKRKQNEIHGGSDWPYSLVVKLFYPQLDFAERQYRHTFGGCFGECLQRQSEYPSCFEPLPHCHNGRWRARWLAKTGYDFGYCEWLFAEEEACRCLAACVPEIGFGEHYG